MSGDSLQPPPLPPAGGAGSGRGGKKAPPKVSLEVLRFMINMDHTDEQLMRSLGRRLSTATADMLCAAAISAPANHRPVKYLGIYAANKDETAISALASLQFATIDETDPKKALSKKNTLTARVDWMLRHIDRPIVRTILAKLQFGEEPALFAASNETMELLMHAETGSIESYFSLRNFAIAFKPFKQLLKNMNPARWADHAVCGSELAKQVLKDLAQNFENENAARLVDIGDVVMEWPTANIYEGIRDDSVFLEDFGEMDPGHTAGTRDELIALRIRAERGDLDAAQTLLDRVQKGVSHASLIAGRMNFSSMEENLDEHPGNLRVMNLLAAFVEELASMAPLDALIRPMREFALIPEFKRYADMIREKLAAMDRSIFREAVEKYGSLPAFEKMFRLAIYIPAARQELKQLNVSELAAIIEMNGTGTEEAKTAIRDLAHIGNPGAIKTAEKLGIEVKIVIPARS